MSLFSELKDLLPEKASEIHELLGCQWGRKIAGGADKGRCQRAATHLVILPGQRPNSMQTFKLCEDHVVAVERDRAKQGASQVMNQPLTGTENTMSATPAQSAAVKANLDAALTTVGQMSTGINVSRLKATLMTAETELKAIQVVNPDTPIVVPPIGTVNGTVGKALEVDLEATGGTAPLKYAVTFGALPLGLSLSSSTGKITGTPTAPADAPVTITVSDSATPAESTPVAFTILIAAVTPPPPPPPVNKPPAAPVISIKGSVVSWPVPASTPPLTVSADGSSNGGFCVYVAGKQVNGSNWQKGLPTSIDLANPDPIWGTGLPVLASGASESITVTAYNGVGQGPQSNAVTYTNGSTPPPPPPPPPPPATGKLITKTAVYVAAADPSGVAAWGKMVNPGGTAPNPPAALEFLDGTSFASISDPSWFCGQWNAANGGKSPGYQMILGIPIIPSGSSSSEEFTPEENEMPWHLRMKYFHRRTGKAFAGTHQGDDGADMATAPSLAQGATGAYNSYFTTCAKSLVANGWGNVYIRLGWEFNGGWFPWAANGQAAAFVAYFEQIVTAMRAVAGANFKFVWNPNIGDLGVGDLMTYKPDPAHYDALGPDVYDNQWGQYDGAANRMNVWLTTGFGLNWFSALAKTDNKPMVVCEWGLGWGVTPSTPGGIVTPAQGANQSCCGGDNAYWITNFLKWVDANAVFAGFFNNAGSGNSSDLLENAPLSRAAFTTALATT